MNKILEFLKRSDFFNNNYAKNIYQVKERQRLEAYKNRMEKKIILLVSISIVFLTILSKKLAFFVAPMAPLTGLVFIIFLAVSIYIVYHYSNIYIKNIKLETKGENELIHKLVFHEFLNELDKYYGFKPNKDLLLKINLMSKEPFLSDSQRLDKINKLLNDYKKDNIFEDFESKSSSAKIMATKSVAKTPVKKPVAKAPAKKTVAKAPAKKTVTKAPAKKTVAKEAVKKPVVKEAVKKPVAKEAVKKPVTKAPAKKTVAKEAVKKPVAKAPAKKPVAKAPTKKPVAKAPAKKQSISVEKERESDKKDT